MNSKLSPFFPKIIYKMPKNKLIHIVAFSYMLFRALSASPCLQSPRLLHINSLSSIFNSLYFMSIIQKFSPSDENTFSPPNFLLPCWVFFHIILCLSHHAALSTSFFLPLFERLFTSHALLLSQPFLFRFLLHLDMVLARKDFLLAPHEPWNLPRFCFPIWAGIYFLSVGAEQTRQRRV